MKRHLLLVLPFYLGLTVFARAEFVVDQATFHTADCWSPALASSPDGLTMMAYGASGDPLLMSFAQVQAFPTVWSDADDWPDPVLLNAGGAPVVCWSRTGFHAAFASGPVILIYHTDLAGNWDLENYELMNANGEVMSLDILGITSDAAGPDVMLTVQTSTNPPDADFHVLYAAHSGFGWTALSEVAFEPQMMPNPQISWAIGPAGPWPQIFYLGGSPSASLLKSIRQDPDLGWQPPVIVPGDGIAGPTPFYGIFDVLTRSGPRRDVLGLGAQPTCPCGTIHHQSQTWFGDWLAAQDVTAERGIYDWPFSPHLAAGPDDEVHAFWYQEAADNNLLPGRRTLEYWVLTDGDWEEAGAFLNEPWMGVPSRSRLALTAGAESPPVLAWARRDSFQGLPLAQQIWIARVASTAPVPEPEQVESGVALRAWPNPFNPAVTIVCDLGAAGPARLGVFDARGRRVALLLDRDLSAGSTEVSWQGRDDSGRSLPSGVYFARLQAGSAQAVQKIVLAE